MPVFLDSRGVPGGNLPAPGLGFGRHAFQIVANRVGLASAEKAARAVLQCKINPVFVASVILIRYDGVTLKWNIVLLCRIYTMAPHLASAGGERWRRPQPKLPNFFAPARKA